MKTSTASTTGLSRLFYTPVRPPARTAVAAVSGATPEAGIDVAVRDGGALKLRPIHPGDVAALQRGFAQLSPEEVRMRFLHPLTEMPEPLARRLCELDPTVEIAFVLVDPAETTGAQIHAVARAYLDPTTNSAEFALLVQKSLTGQGLGERLMRRLIEVCRERGVDDIWGDVLAENGSMLSLCERLGFSQTSVHGDAGLLRVRRKI